MAKINKFMSYLVIEQKISLAKYSPNTNTSRRLLKILLYGIQRLIAFAFVINV